MMGKLIHAESVTNKIFPRRIGDPNPGYPRRIGDPYIPIRLSYKKTPIGTAALACLPPASTRNGGASRGRGRGQLIPLEYFQLGELFMAVASTI